MITLFWIVRFMLSIVLHLFYITIEFGLLDLFYMLVLIYTYVSFQMAHTIGRRGGSRVGGQGGRTRPGVGATASIPTALAQGSPILLPTLHSSTGDLSASLPSLVATTRYSPTPLPSSFSAATDHPHFSILGAFKCIYLFFCCCRAIRQPFVDVRAH